MSEKSVTRLERTWMNRLHTFWPFGLNDGPSGEEQSYGETDGHWSDVLEPDAVILAGDGP